MRLFHRDDRQDEPGATVIPMPGTSLVPADPNTAGTEIEAVEAQAWEEPPSAGALVPARLRELAEQNAGRSLLPSRARVAATIGWYWDHKGFVARRGGVRFARTCCREVWLTLRGGGWLATRWWLWQADAGWHEDQAIALQASQRTYLAEKAAHRERMKFRRILSAGGAGTAGGGVWAAVEMWPHWSVAGGALLLGAVNQIGHWTRPKAQDEPVDAPEPEWVLLAPGVPLGKLTASIIAALTAEGLDDVRPVAPVQWDGQRQRYSLVVTSQHEIKLADLRAVERAIGAADGMIRLLPTAVAANRELVIPQGDPLADVGPPPFIPTGSVSFTDPLDLGQSSDGSPLLIRFAGTHTKAVGITGSGKTEAFLRALLDRLSACCDVVLWGVDPQGGPEFALWEGVLQKWAYELEEIDELLDAALAEMKSRMAVLQQVVRNQGGKQTKWSGELGPALVIVIDEFSLVANQDGKNGKLNLLGKTESIVRLGRKVWIHLVLASQKTGNSDFGSTVMTTQIVRTVMLPCEEEDAVRMMSRKRVDEGWCPHHLTPAEDGDPHDAGKCYIHSPDSRSPEVHRFYRPLRSEEVWHLVRRRISDGLPALDGGTTIDVHSIPECLATIEAAFNAHGNPEVLGAEQIAVFCAENSLRWDDGVRAALRDLNVQTRNKWQQGKRYFLEDVRDAVRVAENGQ